MIIEKQCFRCKETLPASMFHKRKASKDGLNHLCKSCRSKYRRITVDKPLVKDPVNNKVCCRCLKELPRSEFHVDRIKADGLCSRCKECSREFTGREKRPEKPPVGFKRCFKCNTVKPVSEFYRNAYYEDDCSTYCQECLRKPEGHGQRKFAKLPGHKICSSCNEELPLIMFWARSGVSDGKSTYCIDCTKRKRTNHLKHKVNLLKVYGNECKMCFIRFNEDELEVDHIWPVSKRDESPIETGCFENLQLLCKPCNISKKNKTNEYEDFVLARKIDRMDFAIDSFAKFLGEN